METTLTQADRIEEARRTDEYTCPSCGTYATDLTKEYLADIADGLCDGCRTTCERCGAKYSDPDGESNTPVGDREMSLCGKCRQELIEWTKG